MPGLLGVSPLLVYSGHPDYISAYVGGAGEDGGIDLDTQNLGLGGGNDRPLKPELASSIPCFLDFYGGAVCNAQLLCRYSVDAWKNDIGVTLLYFIFHSKHHSNTLQHAVAV